MKQFSLKVQSRSASGRRPSRGQRANGLVPAIIYGKEAPRGLMIDAKSFSKLYKQVSGITALIELEDDKGRKNLSLIQEVQTNRITDAFNHVDFLEVKATEPMKAHVRVRTLGESVGVKMEGALMEVVYPELAIRCLPKDLPEAVEIDVTDLHAGNAVFVRDLKPIAGVKFIDPLDQVVIICNVPEVEEEAAPVAAAATADGAAPAEGAVAADGSAVPAADAKAADGTKAAAPVGGAKAAAPAGKDAKSGGKDAKAPAKDAKKK